MKTRTKKDTKTTGEASKVTNSATPKTQLGPDSTNPPHLFILPKNISTEARIVTLQDPRYSSESRYVICPENGFCEFTKVAAPKANPRSWLLSTEDLEKPKAEPEGYVMKTADLFLATQIDPLFLVLPALDPPPSSKYPRTLYLSGEDYIERVVSASPQFGTFSRIPSVQLLLERRMTAVCDTVEAGDETMFRFNEEKLLKELLHKAQRMIEKALPPSMEEKLVRKALEAPVLGIIREDNASHELANEEDPVPVDSGSQTPDTQTTITSTESAATSFSDASTAATSFSSDSSATETQKPRSLPPITAPDGVADLLRLRTALFFIFAKYLAPHTSESLKTLLSSPESPPDFSPLDTHLAHLAKVRQEAAAARSLGDYSRKRMLDDDEAEEKAEKKRKKEEEEKVKKASMSRGVKALSKVNVSGMKKMSDFFKKK